jgi:dATP pyrophosphohydrolase
MARAPFQVLILPFRKPKGYLQFALFQRTDSNTWQFIAGGGEDSETPAEAAKREAFEEAGLPNGCNLFHLDSTTSIPVTAFTDSSIWGEQIYVIPEYSFGIDTQSFAIVLSLEHTQVRWLDYNAAFHLLEYDSNKTALWELNQKLQSLGPRDTVRASI